ncbi:TIGR03085 family metal-binding protein [Terrabacter aerolatus]|uniref:TIGR03085 family protein n=1 Tax=Terrabacter aerolatus TaxID=422442 RepID=A0A512D6E6_9MICO|nr:TIGR03085 family metal-binding protein [Terrabacter aerolatus]GEO31830.1 TIGR03085 family protein [Terrabacter aerolatus]
MTRHAQSERLQLCDELDRLGPDQPTLCEGWDTRDLAAHLVIREGRPDLAVGAVLPFLAGRLERERRRMALGDYAALVARVRQGAPAWNPMSHPRVDELTNLVEYFVHLEDVRRAQLHWEPRDLAPALQGKLWSALKRSSRLMFRKSATGIVLIGEGQGRHAAKLPDEHGAVVLRGTPAELVLYAYGRKDVARVELEGDADDIAALQQAELGIS